MDNKVDNNFPFKYEGASKKRFTVGFVAAFSLAAALPFLVARFQMCVGLVVGRVACWIPCRAMS